VRELREYSIARRALALGLLAATTLVVEPTSALAQEGSTAARWGGAALGLYSGALLGLAGGVLPCAQVAATRGCSRIAFAAGGAIGGVSGGLLGNADSGRVDDALRASGYGALAGAVVGVVVKELVYYYGWRDVAAFAALGAAIGPVAPAAAVGFAAGGAVGFGLSLIIPSMELTDVAALGSVGLAVGGLAAWAIKAADARDDSGASGPTLTVDLVTLRF
jgi:hypothetical protein